MVLIFMSGRIFFFFFPPLLLPLPFFVAAKRLSLTRPSHGHFSGSMTAELPGLLPPPCLVSVVVFVVVVFVVFVVVGATHETE